MKSNKVLQHQGPDRDPCQGIEDIKMITTKELQELLGVTYRPAVRIGMAAGARFQIGRVIRWRVKDISSYLDKLQAEQGSR